MKKLNNRISKLTETKNAITNAAVILTLAFISSMVGTLIIAIAAGAAKNATFGGF